MDGLAAAARAAAGTGHDLDKVIRCVAALDSLNELAGFPERAHDRDAHVARAGDVERRLLPPVHAAHGGESVRVRILARNKEVRRAQRRVHHAAGRAEDDRRAGRGAERAVELLLGQVLGFNVIRAHHNVQLARRDAHVDIGVARVVFHRRQRAFALFRHARHDRDDEQTLCVDADLFGKVALRHRAEHLLGRLGRGEIVRQFGVLGLHKANPARAAGREHRPLILILVGEALDKLAAFLHDREVGGKVGVEHIVEAQLAQRRDHALGRCELAVEPELLGPCRAHRGRDLCHGDDVRIVDRVEDETRVVALAQRRRRAVGDALAAVRALGILNAAVVRRVHDRARARAEKVPDLHALHVFAHLDAAQALHALVVFANERRGIIHRLVTQLFGEVRAAHVEVVRQLLQGAVAASRAVRARCIVVRKNETQVHAARLARLGAVREDDHAVRHHIVARGDKALHALDLHAADAARADLVDVL